MSDISTTLNACELVWRQQAVSEASIADMKGELESHLRDATAAGKTPESVVGPDISAFAKSWVDVRRSLPVDGRASDLSAAHSAHAEQTRTRLTIALGVILGITAVALIASPRGSAADLETWQWIFVVATFTLLVGELLTGGFFVLPFGIGAMAATALAFARIEPPILLIVFILVSVIALWGLREYARKDDHIVIPVGANRYVGQTAVVTDDISGVGTVGRVRIDTENWMAITDGNERIAAGQVVTVSEVRGARLVVTST